MPIGEAEIARAVRALASGELVVFPTETVYGIGCDALDPQALARLCAVKRRPDEKGIAVILGEAAMLSDLTDRVGGPARRIAGRFWPGPLTLLVPARQGLPAPIVRDGKTGCRVSSDPIARLLAARLGRPIASPSANLSGESPAQEIGAARTAFADRVAVYLDDGPRQGTPSTLCDPGPPLRILREGPIDRAEIESALA